MGKRWSRALLAVEAMALDGPEVEGTWTLTNEGTMLTFTPAEALKPGTSYTIHLGGGMEGDHGEPMNFEAHGSADPPGSDTGPAGYGLSD